MTKMQPPKGAKNVRLGARRVTGPVDVRDSEVAGLEKKGWTTIEKLTTPKPRKRKATTLEGDQDGC